MAAVKYCCVAAGAGAAVGGGGAGGLRQNAAFDYTVVIGSYTVTIGAGGAGVLSSVSGPKGNDGSASVFDTITSAGGGGAGNSNDNGNKDGRNGGSGGGSGNGTGVTANGGSASPAGQGNNGGGNGGFGADPFPAGGGAGAGAVGGTATSTVAGSGGIGSLSNISGIRYAAGGGASLYFSTGTAGTGGLGGGGDGNASGDGSNATANTGSGGGGAQMQPGTKTGGNGSSGVGEIAYPTGTLTATGGTITTSGGNTIHTFTSSGMFEVTAVVEVPVAAFSGTPLTGTAPLNVAFTDASTNTPTSWAWTFGDAGTSTSQNPSHEYAAAGTYSVGLTATNAAGSDLETKTDYVTVSAAVVTSTQQGGGGGYPNDAPLPQYYSRRVLDERVSLPQDAIANPIAIQVLDDAREIEARLAKDDRDFTDMLETTDHMLKQVAVYVESQQIYNIARTIEMKVKARRDAEVAARMKVEQEKFDDAEFAELRDFI